MNTLFYGDNLDVLRDRVPDEAVDLVYLDPPFNSNRAYNAIFREQSGQAPAAQIQAFGDTWQYSQETVRTRDQLLDRGPRYGVPALPDMLDGFEKVLGRNDLTAYLTMMAARLLELRRVLKPTGSLYLHCDPTASHYLKILLDTIFGKENFGNEIIWQRTNAKGLASTRFARNHDIILRYTRSPDAWTWNSQYTEHDPSYLETFYRFVEPETGRRYRLDNLANPNKNRPNLTYEFLGVTRVWRWTRERMQEAYERGLIIQTKAGGVPALKRYLDEQEGTPVGDVWTDIRPIQSQATELLGYPTQKPEALLERIVRASSNEGDVVLDPFCGCGTALSVAQKLKRQWLGIDVTCLAVALIEKRLQDQYELKSGRDYRVVGLPTNAGEARDLAQRDKWQFQYWALTLLPAYPVGGEGAQKGSAKKGADKGIDGLIYFVDGAERRTEKIIVQVKGGDNVGVAEIRDLRGVIEREKAALGFYISLQEPTKPMRDEALGAGLYKSELWGGSYPKLQLRTVAELFERHEFEYPRQGASGFKNAARAQSGTQATLGLDAD